MITPSPNVLCCPGPHTKLHGRAADDDYDEKAEYAVVLIVHDELGYFASGLSLYIMRNRRKHSELTFVISCRQLLSEISLNSDIFIYLRN